MYCGADWEGEAYGSVPGKIRIAPERPFREDFRKKWGADEIVIPGCDNEGDQLHMDNFIDCIRSRKEPNCGADLAHKVMVTIGLSVRSCREGKMFYFDATGERVCSGPPA
jgi:hypothetical protein